MMMMMRMRSKSGRGRQKRYLVIARAFHENEEGREREREMDENETIRVVHRVYSLGEVSKSAAPLQKSSMLVVIASSARVCMHARRS